jgi:hypothetical protein
LNRFAFLTVSHQFDILEIDWTNDTISPIEDPKVRNWIAISIGLALLLGVTASALRPVSGWVRTSGCVDSVCTSPGSDCGACLFLFSEIQLPIEVSAAASGDKTAPLHSITSSARASSGGGTSSVGRRTPRAFRFQRPQIRYELIPAFGPRTVAVVWPAFPAETHPHRGKREEAMR